MNSTLQVWVIFLVFSVRGEERYTTKYDTTDFEQIIKSDRLLKNYVNCLLDRGPCTPDGRELRSIYLFLFVCKLREDYWFPKRAEKKIRSFDVVTKRKFKFLWLQIVASDICNSLDSKRIIFLLNLNSLLFTQFFVLRFISSFWIIIINWYNHMPLLSRTRPYGAALQKKGAYGPHAKEGCMSEN
ncbi:hypothetical protein NQ317_013243 [Molorchus minor]|uniref:Uncharacterized protein n=1 Tax=Molorchus minor TaxID=1323400 RepID=A0ABQ9JY87_9CUCU|nr:hypothetical protein NQ317_013243 [Molorchus minor]